MSWWQSWCPVIRFTLWDIWETWRTSLKVINLKGMIVFKRWLGYIWFLEFWFKRPQNAFPPTKSLALPLIIRFPLVVHLVYRWETDKNIILVERRSWSIFNTVFNPLRETTKPSFRHCLAVGLLFSVGGNWICCFFQGGFVLPDHSMLCVKEIC